MTSFKEASIYNGYNLASSYETQTGDVGLVLQYTAQDNSRQGMGVIAGWGVYRPGHNLSTPHGGYGQTCRKFANFHYRDRNEGLEAAKFWADEIFGARTWVKIAGFGSDWFPKEIADWAKATYTKNPKELKVFGWTGMRHGVKNGNGSSQTREIIAAYTAAEAIRLAGIMRADFDWSGGETTNREERETALAKPGVVFYHPLDIRVGGWVELEPGQGV